MLTTLNTFSVPPSGGNTRDIAEFFAKGMVQIVDNGFLDVLRSIGNIWETKKEITCQLLQVASGTSDPELLASTIKKNIVIQLPSDIHEVCAILRFFGRDGWSFLDIPDGEEETKIILGYVTSIMKYLEMEHELEHGSVEQVHLHAQDFRAERRKPFKILARV